MKLLFKILYAFTMRSALAHRETWNDEETRLVAKQVNTLSLNAWLI